MQKQMEERQRMERQEAKMRRVKAQPILKEDPIPVLEKVRKPLTQVEQFNLHVERRAVDRAQFDERVKSHYEEEIFCCMKGKQQEWMHADRGREGSAQLRRKMVPRARPIPKFDHPFCPQKYVLFVRTNELKALGNSVSSDSFVTS
ncbi:hypothetical protein PIB30_036362 [Stylosanthes scabra]|uniref:TPX2 C-terminal domain-containing protein n=1 Tax=Stylosanthes scabra TaxID=79078 RepID=A0ABU6YE20_9FABA|nr:hypothetical protein [Stylosanthes scabra]